MRRTCCLCHLQRLGLPNPNPCAGVMSKLASTAAGYLGGRPQGSPRTDQAADSAHADSSLLAQLAAETLGLDSWSVRSVANWCGGGAG